MRIICAPQNALPSPPPADTLCFVLYGNSNQAQVGSVGGSLLGMISRSGLSPNTRAWDLLSIALGVVAADSAVSRSRSSDGWTRVLELSVSLIDPDFWAPQATAIASALRFLTGDIWSLSFTAGNSTPPPPRRPVLPQEDSICLLSGGMDSLVGALDLSAQNRHPILVSQVSRGDKTSQRNFARQIGGGLCHLQLNHCANPLGDIEHSQRSRSLIFIAYGVLAATSLDRHVRGESVDLFIPENGFISMNVPLTPLRLGSLSTRTTHPFFLKSLQAVLDTAECRVNLTNPYQFRTKGEMLSGCQNQQMLLRNAFDATSCGRFSRMGYVHCGRCVPCLVRRAAVHLWGQADGTIYRYSNLSIADSSHRDFDDVRAAAVAVEQVRRYGLGSWIGGALNYAQIGDTTPYKAVIERGLGEIEGFLRFSGVL